MKFGDYELDQIYTGDARDLAKSIPDASVDLIFTDPPYIREYIHLYGWLAFEIDPNTADIARDRLLSYQPPLFVPELQQTEMQL